MKIVEWKDDRGLLHKSMLRDADPDELAPMGIPVDSIPDLDQLDWEYMKRELHNALFKAELFTWRDVQAQQVGVSKAILATFKRHVVRLYRMEVNDD